MTKRKDPAAVALGRKGGLKGGRAKTPAKVSAARKNLQTARAKRGSHVPAKKD